MSLPVVTFLDNPPSDAVILESKGWSEGTGGSRVHLECQECHALFVWGFDPKQKWVPDRRYLNFCPGCGKAIAGVQVPACGSQHSISSPMDMVFHCILPVDHPPEKDHTDGERRKWRDTDRGTTTTAFLHPNGFLEELG